LSNVDVHFKSISEPFGDYSSVPSFLITKKAKKYATVMLSGDGGDELFWGYPRFRKSLNQAHWFKYPIWLRQCLIPIFRIKNKNLSSALTVVKKFSDWILNKQTHFTGLDKLMPNYEFSKDLKQLYEINDTLDKPHVLQYLKKNEFYAHMQRTLRKIDLTSMANSLEVRVPFLDKQMIAFSNTIISEFTITHNRPKLILKDALYEYIPIEMVEKEKKGFTVPIKDWLKNDLKEDFIKTVINTPFYGKDYIDITVLHILVQDFYKNTQKVDPWGLWHLYAWQKWAIQNKLVSN
jgi:asparagine synthase (glutamine-hydrolysing)